MNSSKDPLGYYDALGLGASATAEEVKAAYRRLARRYHPDVNGGADPEGRFQAIAQAYSVLADPDWRAAYDRRRRVEASAPSHPAGVLEPIRCSRCGVITPQPRFLLFRRVASWVFFSEWRPVQGLFCSRCARRTALRASAATSLGGWWGVPFGPVLTVAAIAVNALGGARDRANEERLMLHNAGAFARRGDTGLAWALAKRLASARDPQVRSAAAGIAASLQSQAATAPRLRNSWRRRPLHLLLHLLLLALVPAVIATAVWMTSGSAGAVGD